MLIKEYRIPLPLSVEEYRIAQLYMIQKKSRDESSSSGSGVEIIVNEPYKDGPGGNGQYTYKIFHIGSHLPGWFRAILPKSALRVEEEAWNAYPYTKTRYKCPFVEKFLLEIETKYLGDGGEVENVFDLSAAELRNRTVDRIDIVKDPISSGDYRKEEDPKLFKSKTGRGPLSDDWLQEHIDQSKNPGSSGTKIMCAYKLCKVEFRYWGMQSKIERFIHEIGLRKTMLRAHRQAWSWMDEWYGLELSDIRRLEKETQETLAKKMKSFMNENDDSIISDSISNSVTPARSLPVNESSATLTESDSIAKSTETLTKSTGNLSEGSSTPTTPVRRISTSGTAKRKSWENAASASRRSQRSSSRSMSDWVVEKIEDLADTSDEEFFDAQEEFAEDANTAVSGVVRTSSMEALSSGDHAGKLAPDEILEEEYLDSIDCQMIHEAEDADTLGESTDSTFSRRLEQFQSMKSRPKRSDHSPPNTPSSKLSPSPVCNTNVLFLVLHGGSILDSGQFELGSQRSDISTLRGTFDKVIRAHYPAMYGHLAIRLVRCPLLCAETLQILESLSPFGYDSQRSNDDTSPYLTDNLPLGAISLFATSNADYQDQVIQVIARANQVYNDFLRSEEGKGFNGQVCMIGDCSGGIFGYDALCYASQSLLSRTNSRHGSHSSLTEGDDEPVQKLNVEPDRRLSSSNPDLTTDDPRATYKRAQSDNRGISSNEDKPLQHKPVMRHLSLPPTRRISTGSSQTEGNNDLKLEFEVTDFFLFGSPLALVLAYRRINSWDEKHIPPLKPSCLQLYNLFHSSDPSAARLEPLLDDRFRQVPPVKISRYSKFPLGDGQSLHVVETVQTQSSVFLAQEGTVSSPRGAPMDRRESNISMVSQLSGQADPVISSIASVVSKWWGSKRLDYALYCPEALNSFPVNALPHLFHSSYWESTDVVAFILRQIVRQDDMYAASETTKDASIFRPPQPREKWLHRRTTIKVRNVGPNHRGNDTIVQEDRPQVLAARFMYGPLDIVQLSREKVDIHVMTQPPSGEWLYFGTEITDSHGRVSFKIPEDKRLSQGMYPVKMVVRGDHTCADFYLAVLPPKTEAVVFSIDGSFTASVSIMGKDPKVRAGAVDVVRHWQDLGYLIIYVSARPDMQQKRVVSWLAQHNFPHGMVSFMDGLSADPLRQKTQYLKNLVSEAEISIHAAYGSSKDIAVYQAVGCKPEQIYIVGKVAKKYYQQAQVCCPNHKYFILAAISELQKSWGENDACL
ncbi:protein retinal degeneration B isoform X1 [Lingula anatina]|uniref:Protein retinal degeneration B isoform X1 n=1 Tax=Lingula anatina TaxID=7574 RepID=A0A2R2MKG5_LINAN|nr:protein retinal degeneration B isoform X1 [Lingula anatina]XP_023930714.1 protein retinal degeneration B isoform X1 [Lingula anatina]XP_023930715.1 protein retinal degeneration B isoform X1 [Lingula anatina]|eukprot:XP_023930713.1 protein retinal degeneration B isoform X1 [Lingula anatina]